MKALKPSFTEHNTMKTKILLPVINNNTEIADKDKVESPNNFRGINEETISLQISFDQLKR